MPGNLKPRVMFVDDALNQLQAVRRLFYDIYDLHMAAGAEAALVALQTADPPFDVVVSDYRMPGMNGVRFLREARRVAPDTMRVLLTGDFEAARAEVIREGDIFCILTKPYLSATLGRAVDAAVLERRRRTSELEAS